MKISDCGRAAHQQTTPDHRAYTRQQHYIHSLSFTETEEFKKTLLSLEKAIYSGGIQHTKYVDLGQFTRVKSRLDPQTRRIIATQRLQAVPLKVIDF